MSARTTPARLVAAGALAASALGAARAAAQDSAAAPATYAERYRPQYHFTPARNWMNDPNGLVYYDGEFHLFYQYNPFGNKWGHMSWGHAVSPDLVHWTHLPVAIPEADGVMAFSGSAVVDRQNTSGFGRDGRPPLVAVYTGHKEHSQTQNLAYSTDRGRTWTRYAANPVLDLGLADFRDPKVFWYAPGKQWVMVVALPQQHQVRFYASPDLKRWTRLSEFGPAGAVGGVWECPDLFALPVEGNAADRRWVLIVNLNPGGAAGGSGTQYFVGRFDGTHFVADAPAAATSDVQAPGVRWADYGRDFYAAVSWSDVPRSDGRRLWVGWMNNWDYAQAIPTSPWRSAMSVPRALSLVRTADGLRLAQHPVRELERLRGARVSLGARAVAEGATPLAAQGVAGRALELDATFAVDPAARDGAREFGLAVRTGGGKETVIGIDPAARRLFVDRRRSGDVAFDPKFATARQTAPLPVEHGAVRLRVFVDWSSVEVFAGDGRAALTDQIFPAPGSAGVSLFATGGAARLVSLDAWPLATARGRPRPAPGAAPTR